MFHSVPSRGVRDGALRPAARPPHPQHARLCQGLSPASLPPGGRHGFWKNPTSLIFLLAWRGPDPRHLSFAIQTKSNHKEIVDKPKLRNVIQNSWSKKKQKQKQNSWSLGCHWVAQSFKLLTLGFSSGHDLSGSWDWAPLWTPSSVVSLLWILFFPLFLPLPPPK